MDWIGEELLYFRNQVFMIFSEVALWANSVMEWGFKKKKPVKSRFHAQDPYILRFPIKNFVVF